VQKLVKDLRDGVRREYEHFDEHSKTLETVTASGTWGSGSLAIRMNVGAGAVTVYTMTADEVRVFDFPANAAITFVLSGATSPSLTIEVR
jgi:hypothetical protein